MTVREKQQCMRLGRSPSTPSGGAGRASRRGFRLFHRPHALSPAASHIYPRLIASQTARTRTVEAPQRIPSTARRAAEMVTRPHRRPRPLAVSLLLVIATLLLSFVPHVSASALTTTIAANERTCFYALVDKAGEKVRHFSKRVREHTKCITMADGFPLLAGRILLRGQCTKHASAQKVSAS